MSATKLRVKELLREKGWTTKMLAEKTGMSESYLTHIKNSTRRWNEDSLKKLADAFGVEPIELFSYRRQRAEVVSDVVPTELIEAEGNVKVSVQMVPIMKEIPEQPSPYNNQVMQASTGHKGMFVPIASQTDPNIFALNIATTTYAPIYEKGDLVIISPEAWSRSGDIVAVEYGKDSPTRGLAKIMYSEEFIILEVLGAKQGPTVFLRGKDLIRILGRVIERHQRFWSW